MDPATASYIYGLAAIPFIVGMAVLLIANFMGWFE